MGSGLIPASFSRMLESLRVSLFSSSTRKLAPCKREEGLFIEPRFRKGDDDNGVFAGKTVGSAHRFHEGEDKGGIF